MSIHLKPFPQLRQTDIPWYGALPSHWQLCPGMAVLKPKQIKNVGLREKTVLSLSYGRIVIKPEEKLHGLVPASFEGYQIVEPGNVIIRPTDLQNDQTSLRVGQSEHRGIITSAYLCLEARGDMNAAYAYALLHAYDIQKVFYSMGSGLRQNLDWSDFRRLPIPVPPPEEQDAIVRFVRHLDLRVNRLLKTKRRLIDLLNEQKQAIIHRAVTRGLDPEVRLKASGVEWLGDVPEHWKCLRSRYVYREVDVRSIRGEELHLSMTQDRGLIPSDQLSVRRLVSESYAGGKICHEGDLVLNRLKAHLGVFALAPSTGVISPDYSVFRPIQKLEPKYFELVYRTPACRVELRKRAKGIVQGFWRLYTDDFYDIAVPVPPQKEQTSIVRFLDEELSALNVAGIRANTEIDRIREYRTRLVSDVVTGQLDVRGLDLTEMEEAAVGLSDVAEDGDGLPGEEPEGDNE